jgi:CBS domain-containing protein
MRVSEIMTKDPVFCDPNTPLEQVARAMIGRDCGCIPVVEGQHVVGVVTDRDIAIRAVAAGRDCAKTPARDCMSHPVATISTEASIDECRKIMEENQVRRIPVLTNRGTLVGMISQGDLALHEENDKTGELVRDISKPGGAPLI